MYFESPFIKLRAIPLQEPRTEVKKCSTTNAVCMLVCTLFSELLSAYHADAQLLRVRGIQNVTHSLVVEHRFDKLEILKLVKEKVVSSKLLACLLDIMKAHELRNKACFKKRYDGTRNTIKMSKVQKVR
ncbi:hypothetical protein OUZ56_002186 [Daphnia magna]|uniref:Uncharacterized protein n=1 Tax=Daphnia magna TaxID=35525 RepID=A0ABR0A4X5_9CRUS|nr:hypothetical protein OUZ56_002186 [Daphnia magna]